VWSGGTEYMCALKKAREWNLPFWKIWIPSSFLCLEQIGVTRHLLVISGLGFGGSLLFLKCSGLEEAVDRNGTLCPCIKGLQSQGSALSVQIDSQGVRPQWAADSASLQSSLDPNLPGFVPQCHPPPKKNPSLLRKALPFLSLNPENTPQAQCSCLSLCWTFCFPRHCVQLLLNWIWFQWALTSLFQMGGAWGGAGGASHFPDFSDDFIDLPC
jgi:hypothetical protein